MKKRRKKRKKDKKRKKKKQSDRPDYNPAPIAWRKGLFQVLGHPGRRKRIAEGPEHGITHPRPVFLRELVEKVSGLPW